jgi:hypothetical protein
VPTLDREARLNFFDELEANGPNALDLLPHAKAQHVQKVLAALEKAGIRAAME